MGVAVGGMKQKKDEEGLNYFELEWILWAAVSVLRQSIIVGSSLVRNTLFRHSRIDWVILDQTIVELEDTEFWMVLSGFCGVNNPSLFFPTISLCQKEKKEREKIHENVSFIHCGSHMDWLLFGSEKN